MTDPNVVRRALRQQVYSHARSDLFSYTQLMFNEAEPSGTFIEANHTKALATAIEKVICGDTRRLLIAIPPRFGKSLLASVMAPTWILGNDPSYKIVAASYGDELARVFAAQSRNIMNSRVYRELFPQASLAAGGGGHWPA